MNTSPLFIQAGWDAFATDMLKNGITQAELASIKLIWFSGAITMGILMTSRDVTTEVKIAEFDKVMKFITSQPQFQRLAAALNKCSEHHEHTNHDGHDVP
jgi:uncharacterized membrane protein YfbV (UPF0208 family)